MKLNFSKTFILFSIFGIFCLKKVYADDDDEDECGIFCEIFAQIFSIVIGLIVRSVIDTCIENGNCGHVFGTFILYLAIFLAIMFLLHFLLLLCGIDIKPPKNKSKYRLRTGGFLAGLLLGGKNK
jgi:hypothetical protein